MKNRMTVISSILVIAVLLASCAPVASSTATPASNSSAEATQAPVVQNVTTVSEESAYTQIYDKVNPSVVNIRVVQNASNTQQDSSFPFFSGFS